MRLLLEADPQIHLVRRYGEGEIVIGEQRLTRPLIITPRQLLPDWDARTLAELTEAELGPLLGLGAQIVLLGAGDTHPFPSASVRESFRARGIALECMNLGAACRTYNILANEARPVAAGLFPGLPAS